MGVESHTLKVSVECFSCDILCKYVCRVVVGVYLDESDDVVENELLYEEVSQFNVFCFP